MNVTMSANVSDCGTYRWMLSRSWGDGRKVCWILLNPSTADDCKEDHTSRRVLHFAKAWDYHALTVVNLYPFRSPHVSKCRDWAKGDVRLVLKQNLIHIKKQSITAEMMIAAWGNNAWDALWIDKIVSAIIAGRDRPLYCLGTTLSGAPIHPGARGTHRVPDDQMPVMWKNAF